MKKLMITLMFVLTATSVSFGAVPEDMSVYLRKDVFDAKMEAFMNEIRGELKGIRGELQVMNTKIDALSRRVDDNFNTLAKRIDDNNRKLERRMDGLGTRISNISNGMYFPAVALAIFGVVVLSAIIVTAFQILDDRKTSKQQFATLEDVKRLIAESKARQVS